MKPLALVSTVVPPIVVVFSAVPVAAGAAELAPVTTVPEVAVLPEDLDGVAALLAGIRFPPWGGGAHTIDRTDRAWDLAIPLPFADRADVELTRVTDDLVVTVAGTRRALRLDALLRRCTVTGGRLDTPGTAGARLVVSFEPDPRLWPADLLAAHGSAS